MHRSWDKSCSTLQLDPVTVTQYWFFFSNPSLTSRASADFVIAVFFDQDSGVKVKSFLGMTVDAQEESCWLWWW
jgi:hypothetical protein